MHASHISPKCSLDSTFSDSFLEVEELTVILDQRLILEKLSFSLYFNEIVMLIGPNGGGKSTLVRTLLALNPLSSGKIIRRTPHLKIGYVPQRQWSNPEMTLSAQTFLELHPRSKNTSCLKKALQFSEFSDHLRNQSISRLSGGEKQRLLLARALLNEPQWLVLDEPTAHLDLDSQKRFYHRLSEIRENFNCAILFVSHDIHRVFAKADRILCLDKKFRCKGKPLHAPCQSCRQYEPDLDPNLSCYQHNMHSHSLNGNKL